MRKNLRRRTGDLATLPDTAQVRSDSPAAPCQADAARDQTDEPSAAASRRQRPAWFRMLPEICALAFCAVLYSRTGAWDTDRVFAGAGVPFGFLGLWQKSQRMSGISSSLTSWTRRLARTCSPSRRYARNV